MSSILWRDLIVQKADKVIKKIKCSKYVYAHRLSRTLFLGQVITHYFAAFLENVFMTSRIVKY